MNANSGTPHDAAAFGFRYNGTGYDLVFATVKTDGGTMLEAAQINGNGQFGMQVKTVATLGATTAGLRSCVSDATQTLTAGIGAVVVGGGANNVPVYSDGTNWRIG